jgi:hypothetical protein
MFADSAVLDSEACAVVRAKAAGLVGTYGFNAADRADIQQELLLDCVVRACAVMIIPGPAGVLFSASWSTIAPRL